MTNGQRGITVTCDKILLAITFSQKLGFITSFSNANGIRRKEIFICAFLFRN